MEARRFNVAIALLVLFMFSSFHGSSAQPHFSDADINALLEDLRGKGFFTGATILSYVARSYLAPSSTLLIPTDKSLAQAVSIEPKDYAALIKFHVLETDFDFNQLRLLPVGTWIPTALQGYGVVVTNNSASDFSLNNAQIIDGNICPHVANIGISCQGVSAVLDPSSKSSERPNNPPLGPAPAFASAPTPSQSSSPSPSPLASTPSASIPPLQFLSPASSPSLSPSSSPSPSLSPSSSPSPSPSLIEPVPLALSPSESPFGAVSPVPSSPIFQSPPISPSSPLQFPPFFEADAPGPSPSASSGAVSMVVSQINTLALATLGGFILAMI